MRYALFIGRWRTFHEGHLWLVRQQLDQGQAVWIMVRPTDETPSTTDRGRAIISALEGEGYEWERDFVVTVLEHDIASVNYGRGVGYEVIEHVPPEEVAIVSSTEILDGSEGDD